MACDGVLRGTFCALDKPRALLYSRSSWNSSWEGASRIPISGVALNSLLSFINLRSQDRASLNYPDCLAFPFAALKSETSEYLLMEYLIR